MCWIDSDFKNCEVLLNREFYREKVLLRQK
jgi:hypothetical protein